MTNRASEQAGIKPIRPRVPRAKSHLEESFAQAWRLLKPVGFPEPAREVRVVDGRRFRWDFAFVEQKVAIEIHGGVYTQGRHTRGAGFQAEGEKRRLAMLDGWRWLEYTAEDLKDAVKVVREVSALLRARVLFEEARQPRIGVAD